MSISSEAMTQLSNSNHSIVWLEHHGQRLGLVPELGGGVAAWIFQSQEQAVDLWRPWSGETSDMYSLASFPMVPWSNRISGGGFEHEGRHYPLVPNRANEPYPIHGDGWLQGWTLQQTAVDAVEMVLESRQFDGTPYHYRAIQRFVLRPDGMDQSLHVTHLGAHALPYGLGQHPWFPRSAQTRLTAQVGGVWLSDATRLPLAHSRQLPDTWDLRHAADVNGSLVDNAFTQWSGSAHIDWPEHQLRLQMTVPEIVERGANDGFCLLYRPPLGPAFCFEPITHPIDAFHDPLRTGLRVLQTGESMVLNVQWRVERMQPGTL